MSKTEQFFMSAKDLACLEDIWHPWLLLPKARRAQRHFETKSRPTLSQTLARKLGPP